LFVVYAWGYGALAVGLIFAGVGVVPVALLAALFHAEWSVLLELVVGIVLTFGARFLGLWLTTPKQETEEQVLVDY
jgi:type IV secretory pathway VirB2 component (pilin)